MGADVKQVETRTVAPEDAETRLDRWFKRHYPGLAFGRVAKLLRTGQVRVDGKRAKANQRLSTGQEIRVPPLPADAAQTETPDRQTATSDPRIVEQIRDAIVYCDDWVLALNKPPGIASQGGTQVRDHIDGLSDALRFDAAEPPKLVHRLDKDTSGLLLLGRSAQAAARLGQAFRTKDARKIYWALTAGIPKPRTGLIDRPLAKRKRGGGEKMDETPSGKPAQTAYVVITTAKPGIAWVALSPLTGRTHQLRAHMALLGTPVLGDGKYGGAAAFPKNRNIDNLHLHAWEIALPHPDDGTTLRLTAPLPDHMATSFAQLEFDAVWGEDIDPAGR